jgi:broad specificity phosphatase PhoE
VAKVDDTGGNPMNEPSALWLLRHGQSEGNVVRDAAQGTDEEILDIADRDMDVPLSALGHSQALGFGRWLGRQPASDQPDIILSSPYRRAVETAAMVLEGSGLDLPVFRDERLRERELGILDLLTGRGVRARFPAEAERRRRLGKFYYRPPGGESWVDVALRLRSLRDSLGREHSGRRVLLVTHEVVIVVMRYLIDDLDEEETLRLNQAEPLANCSLTTYHTDAEGRTSLDRYGWSAPLEEEGAAVTEEPDAPVASR